jgi:hypothetical protein
MGTNQFAKLEFEGVPMKKSKCSDETQVLTKLKSLQKQKDISVKDVLKFFEEYS